MSELTNLQALIESRKTVFSPCRKWRYTLWRDLRELGTPKPNEYAMWIGLNPSTADETQDDPTIRRCKAFTVREGYGWYLMTNLFAWRDTQPAAMKRAVDPIGPDNDKWLFELALGAGVVLAAWGANGRHLNRAEYLAMRLCSRGVNLQCLRYNDDGSPEHPLYVPANEPMKPWPRRSDDCVESDLANAMNELQKEL